MNKNKGFTLIELLVVIAIIGILSSVVLASLSGARAKAKVAAVQSTLSSMRSQAEIGVDNGKYIANICANAEAGVQGSLKPLIDSLNKTSSKVQTIRCVADSADKVSRNWAVEVKIYDKYYCADSSGYSGVSKNGTTEGTTITGGSEVTVSSNSTITTGVGSDFSCGK
mgnify:CR=1 FL=1